MDSVTGKRVAGPLQGFGQLWQKTFRVPLEGSAMTPQEVIAVWKERFATFWPKAGRFYAPLAGIVPGEVALLDIAPVPGAPVKLSTGVMVIYADDESFTFITPEGHTLSAWITFSAYRDGDVTSPRSQALERTIRSVRRARPNVRRQQDERPVLGRHAGRTSRGTMGTTEPSVGLAGRLHRQATSVAATPRNLRNSVTLRTMRQTLDGSRALLIPAGGEVERRMTTPDARRDRRRSRAERPRRGPHPGPRRQVRPRVRGGPTIGGGTRTEELTLPGFRHDVCSTILPLTAASPFFRTIDWDADGVELIHPDAPLAHALDDGRAAVLERSVHGDRGGPGP